MLFQIKAFFIQRNLDGKSLFRVLSKQVHSNWDAYGSDSSRTKGLTGGASRNSDNTESIKEEILWKVYEMIFVIAFFCKDDVTANSVLGKNTLD